MCEQMAHHDCSWRCKAMLCLCMCCHLDVPCGLQTHAWSTPLSWLGVFLVKWDRGLILWQKAFSPWVFAQSACCARCASLPASVSGWWGISGGEQGVCLCGWSLDVLFCCGGLFWVSRAGDHACQLCLWRDCPVPVGLWFAVVVP